MSDPLGLIHSTVAGGYLVTDLVAHGELSIVYRVRAVSDQQPFALKCYTGVQELPEPARVEFRARLKQVTSRVVGLADRFRGFARPIRIGSVKIRPGQEAPATLFEWLNGQTLERLLDAERVRGVRSRTARTALGLLREPFAALAAAHEAGLIHRNITPGGIFVCSHDLEGAAPAKWLDFSLAKLGGHGVDALPFFSPDYAAPEQFWGDEASVGPWTDVFALALVFVEFMNGGRPALDGRDIVELQAASEDRTRRPTPRTHGLDVSNATESVFRRALAVEPRDRFANAGEFLYALERSLTCGGRLTSTQISRVSGILDDEEWIADAGSQARTGGTSIGFAPSMVTVLARNPYAV